LSVVAVTGEFDHNILDEETRSETPLY